MEEQNHIPAKPSVFIDDLSVPSESLFYFSKKRANLRIILSICAILLGLFMLLPDGNQPYFGGDTFKPLRDKLYGLGYLAFGIYVGFTYYKKGKNAVAQIILNKSEIQFPDSDLIKWSEIDGEEVN